MRKESEDWKMEKELHQEQNRQKAAGEWESQIHNVGQGKVSWNGEGGSFQSLGEREYDSVY